jgi:AraC-like DNA-binding protein
VRYAAHEAPGFTIIIAGEAWVEFDGREPLHLTEGDFLLMPTTPAFSLTSEIGFPCIPTAPSNKPVRHGDQDGEPDFLSLGGSFAFERINAPLLLTLLPGVIHIPASEGRTSQFGRLIDLFSAECTSSHPGKDLVIERLLEVLLIEALRWRGMCEVAGSAGLIAGMGDPALARSLHAIHAEPSASWTVDRLARIAGMSRSAFSAKFGFVVGCAPIEYLSRWRMAIARDLLVRGGMSLDRIASEIGYESASAFSTAFRKRLGCPPGSFARDHGARTH